MEYEDPIEARQVHLIREGSGELIVVGTMSFVSDPVSFEDATWVVRIARGQFGPSVLDLIEPPVSASMIAIQVPEWAPGLSVHLSKLRAVRDDGPPRLEWKADVYRSGAIPRVLSVSRTDAGLPRLSPGDVPIDDSALARLRRRSARNYQALVLVQGLINEVQSALDAAAAS